MSELNDPVGDPELITPYGPVRWMIGRDLPEVLEIEKRSCREPWGEQEVLEFTRGRANIGMVYELGGKVLGYMMYTLRSQRLEVVKLVVDPGHRRLGFGTQMLDKLKSKLGYKRNRISIDVWEGDLKVHLWLKARGFRCTRVERGVWGDDAAYHFVWKDPVKREVGSSTWDCQGR